MPKKGQKGESTKKLPYEKRFGKHKLDGEAIDGKSKLLQVSNFYARRAGPTLQKLLEELRVSSPEDRHSLAGEIDIARAACLEAVDVFNKVCIESGDQKGKISDMAKDLSIQILQRSLNNVAELVSKAAKVHSIQSQVFDREVVGHVIEQLTHIIEKKVAVVSPRLADEIIEAIQNIKVPDRAVKAVMPVQAQDVIKALEEIEASSGENAQALPADAEEVDDDGDGTEMPE